MRVLLWTELFWPYVGGAEILSGKFALAMKNRGHEFTVITLHGNLDLSNEDHYQGISFAFDFGRRFQRGKSK